jgi:MOSC domain-containing protein YiiM
MTGRIASLNRSSGGVPKLSADQAWASRTGMEGDKQRDLRYHGGPERALSLYSLELIDQLRLEGHPIVPGAAGENVTISGLDWSRVVPGAELRLGDVSVAVTSFAVPCKTIRRAFLDEDFTRISQKLYPGWSRAYARVLNEGLLSVGAPVDIDGVLAGL